MRATLTLRAALIAATVAASIAAPAAAQVVTTRSGEHPNFSRLVLAIPPGTAWTLGPAPGGFDLALPPGAAYDLAGAFEKIPRDRLAALEPLGGGRLRLSVGCDCHVEAFLHRDDLVIDVIDGPAPPGSLAPGPTPGPGRPPVGIALPLLPAPRTADLLLPPLGPLAPALAAEAYADAEAAEDHADRVAETQAAILEGFGRAATQGLLDVAPGRDVAAQAEEPRAEAAPAEAIGPAPDPAAPPAAETPAVEDHAPEGDAGQVPPGPDATAPVPSGEAALVAALEAAGRPGLALRTSIDRDRPGAEAPLAASGATCVEDAAFDLAAWEGEGGFATTVAVRAAALSDERDAWSDVAVEDLARAYLAFGFGREAAQALAVDGRHSAGRDRLLVIAALVDGDAVPADAFADQAGCTGPVAFWRALARGTLRGTDERERTAMTVALRALPEALRGHLAPRLADLFLDAGDGGGAREIVEMAAGTDAAPATATQIAAAAITEELEGPAPAIAELTAIAATDARVTPEAVIDLIDLTLAEGRAVSEETLVLARSLRFERRGTAAERALLAAEVRALAGASLFAEAVGLIETEGRLLPRSEADGLMADVVGKLTRELPDPAFLEAALRVLPRGLPAVAARPVAERLTAMGFGPESEAWLARATAPDPNPLAEAAPEAPRHPPAATHVGEAVVGGSHVSASQEAGDRLGAVATPDDATRPAVEQAAAGQVVPEAVAPPPVLAIETVASEPAASGAVTGLEAPSPPGAVLVTLAERHALLDAAASARARATALLDAGLATE